MKKISTMLCLLMMGAPAFGAQTVRIDDNNAFPESLSSANRTLYIGSSGKGIIYRAKPGSRYAEPWLQPPEGHNRALGVLADASSKTLWVCYSGGPAGSSVRSFDLGTGAPKENYGITGGGCNDVALHNGDLYVTAGGRILKLAKGATALADWYQAPPKEGMDGLVWGKDGKFYTNTYSSGHIIQINVNADGTAGGRTILNTSIPLFQCDGMRLSSNGKLLLVEGQGRLDSPNLKMGRVDEVTIEGDNATVRVIKDGFELPTAVTPVGNTIYVLESKLDYHRRPELKGKDPGAFYAYAVPFH